MEKMPCIEGIDVEAAVKDMNGKLSGYLETLGVFRREIPFKIEEINRAREEGNSAEFTILVHGIKGASRMLGIHGLADMMYGLEIASKTGDEDFIESNLGEGITELLKYYDILKEYDTRKPPEAMRETSDNVLAEALYQLKQCLDEFEDEAAAQIVEEIGQFLLRDDQRKLYEKLYGAIDRFEYYESVEYTDKLIETLGK